MNCPACGYDLTGLPEEHRCPECGFVYDAHTIVIDFRLPRALAWQMAYVAAWVAWAWFLFWRHAVDARWIVAAVLASAVLLLWRYHQLNVASSKSGRCILCKGGIAIERPREESWHETWVEFDRSHIGLVQGRLRIWNKQGRIVFDAPYRHFGSYKNAKRCAREINRLAKVYGEERGGQG